MKNFSEFCANVSVVALLVACVVLCVSLFFCWGLVAQISAVVMLLSLGMCFASVGIGEITEERKVDAGELYIEE